MGRSWREEIKRLLWKPPIIRVPDKLDTSEGDTPVATEFAKMTTALRDEMDAERWQRAKAYIEQQIETRELAAKDVWRLDRIAAANFEYEVQLLRTILDRAEGRNDG